MTLQLERTIKAGDILTSLTILLSVVALLFSLAKDRGTRVREEANKVRTAAATILVRLDRWQGLQISLYQELQPTFVELSEELGTKYEVVVVRDKFWKQVNLGRTKIAGKVLEELLGIAYADLLTHFPSARLKVVNAFTALAEVEKRSTEIFMGLGEQHILSLRGKEAKYQTADLGNLLRDASGKGVDQFKKESDEVLASVREYLFQVIAMSDTELVVTARTKHSDGTP